jgi:drug/metabolite transporter (DMT)-like permease
MVTYLLLILGMFFFGLSFIASKYALILFDPITIILVRAVIASSLLASWPPGLLASWLPGRVGRVSLSG